jgi:hypothetical protein
VGANGASTRTAPSLLKAVARLTASRTAEASGVNTRAAPSQPLQAAHSTASRMGAAGVSSNQTAPSLLEATRGISDELTVLYSNGPDDKVN